MAVARKPGCHFGVEASCSGLSLFGMGSDSASHCDIRCLSGTLVCYVIYCTTCILAFACNFSLCVLGESSGSIDLFGRVSAASRRCSSSRATGSHLCHGVSHKRRSVSLAVLLGVNWQYVEPCSVLGRPAGLALLPVCFLFRVRMSRLSLRHVFRYCCC